jgi:hypothetical protein
MRRIAGTFVVLAAFSGCAPQARVAQGDQPMMIFQNRMAQSGPSWQPRNDQLQADPTPAPEPPSPRNMANSFVVAQQNAGTLPMVSPPVQIASKPSFPQGVAGAAAPLPVAAELTNPGTGVAPAAFTTIDPALKDMDWVRSDKAAADKAATTAADAFSSPRVLELPASPVKLPEIVIESKQAPVSVAIDSKSSPIGSPSLRLVNTKRFTLSFSVQDVGSTVAAIDLWETRDSKSWRKCDNATAQPGAYLVEVKDEGVFGYTMVARPVGDKSSTQPKAGDVPQVWVTVDATKPAVALSGVELNLASKTPNLIVRWTAKDRNFGPRPVTLSYSDRGDGPWLPLAANIDNSGRYECAIPTNMPKRAFLRIEAVDLVGNTGSAQTEKSVRLDFAAPPVPVANLLPPPPPAAQPPAEPQRPLVVINGVESNAVAKE